MQIEDAQSVAAREVNGQAAKPALPLDEAVARIIG